MYKTRIKEKWWFSQCGRTRLSAERQVLIPAEHLCCDFTCRPWAKNHHITNDLFIHYIDKSTGTPPSLEEKKALTNCGNKDGNIIHVLKNCISTSVATVLKCIKITVPICHWCLVINKKKNLWKQLFSYRDSCTFVHIRNFLVRLSARERPPASRMNDTLHLMSV